jgi:hypothetical protein
MADFDHSELLSFWNFIRPSDDILEEYHGPQPEYKTFEDRVRGSTNHWYDWNNRNWGTKWEACDSEITSESEGSVTYGFRTAWAPPEPVFREMVRQHPGLDFEIKCVEEQGWGVEYSGIDGDLLMIDQWSIPESHEDSVERTGECQCGWLDDTESEYMFDDCPRKKEVSNA